MKDFKFKEVGNKLNYAVFHPNVENGKKLLGWIRKYCVDKKKEKDK